MINEKEIDLIYKFKQQNPWSGYYETKFEKFQWFLAGLCQIHLVHKPELFIPKNPKKWKFKGEGDCTFRPARIRSKFFSVIIILHEFKHWLDYNLDKDFEIEDEQREWDALYYSNLLFYMIWPERLQDLEELQVLAQDKKAVKCLQMQKDARKDPHSCAILDSIVLANEYKTNFI